MQVKKQSFRRSGIPGKNELLKEKLNALKICKTMSMKDVGNNMGLK